MGHVCACILPIPSGHRQECLHPSRGKPLLLGTPVPVPQKSELQKASLLRAVEVAIVVDDVSVALVVIIQFCVVPIAIVGLAARMEIVAAGTDFFAGLNLRTVRAVDR